MPSICQAPVLCSVRIDQEVQAAAIGKLVRLILRLGISASHIRQWHVGISLLASIRYQQICQQNDGMLANSTRTSANVRTPGYYCRIGKKIASADEDGCLRT